MCIFFHAKQRAHKSRLESAIEKKIATVFYIGSCLGPQPSLPFGCAEVSTSSKIGVAISKKKSSTFEPSVANISARFVYSCRQDSLLRPYE